MAERSIAVPIGIAHRGPRRGRDPPAQGPATIPMRPASSLTSTTTPFSATSIAARSTQAVAEDLTSNVFLAALSASGAVPAASDPLSDPGSTRSRPNEVRMHYRRDKRIRKLVRRIAEDETRGATSQ